MNRPQTTALTRLEAEAYVEAYSKLVSDKPDNLTDHPDGSFSCFVANIRFDFEAPNRRLIVRAIIEPVLDHLRPDILERLRQVEKKTPSEVDGARFEYTPGFIPFAPTRDSLFLRTDLISSERDPHQVAQEWDKLGKTAYMWHRSRLGAVMDEANAARHMKPQKR